MMIEAPGITVNGIKITPEQISAEVQYHPAHSLIDAKYNAMQALVIRELLIQQAVKLGLCEADKNRDAPDHVIDRLLEQEIVVPEPSLAECERYYSNNAKRFYTSPLFEASHILYLAPPDDEEARNRARNLAEKALSSIRSNPEMFEIIARSESACSSAKLGGNLGQISRGQTLPAFEAALHAMKEGGLSEEPVLTEVGYHIIHLHRQTEGQLLPFDSVSQWVGDHLKKESWQRAFSQYIQILAGQAKISGFRLHGADTPLVQ
ncbi:MAG: peptidylprolyl isomerase [Micavibrio sp.]